MDTAELAWWIVLGVVVLLAVIGVISNIPELRRYFRIRDM
jgi:hypothetical protein